MINNLNGEEISDAAAAEQGLSFNSVAGVQSNLLELSGFKLQPVSDECLLHPLGRNIVYQIVDKHGRTKVGNYWIHEVLNPGPSGGMKADPNHEKNGFSDLIRFGLLMGQTRLCRCLESRLRGAALEFQSPSNES